MMVGRRRSRHAAGPPWNRISSRSPGCTSLRLIGRRHGCASSVSCRSVPFGLREYPVRSMYSKAQAARHTYSKADAIDTLARPWLDAAALVSERHADALGGGLDDVERGHSTPPVLV